MYMCDTMWDMCARPQTLQLLKHRECTCCAPRLLGPHRIHSPAVHTQTPHGQVPRESPLGGGDAHGLELTQPLLEPLVLRDERGLGGLQRHLLLAQLADVQRCPLENVHLWHCVGSGWGET